MTGTDSDNIFQMVKLSKIMDTWIVVQIVYVPTAQYNFTFDKNQGYLCQWIQGHWHR